MIYKCYVCHKDIEENPTGLENNEIGSVCDDCFDKWCEENRMSQKNKVEVH